MKRLLFLPLALAALAGCEVVNEVPPEAIIVGCAVGPVQFPEYADEINAACAVLAADALVRVVTEDPEPDEPDVVVVSAVSSD